MEKLERRTKLKIGDTTYIILKFLSVYKGDTVYLATDGNCFYQIRVLSEESKQSEKTKTTLEKLEKNYEILKDIGINVPALVCVDKENGYVVREYREGSSAASLMFKGEFTGEMLEQVRDMAIMAEAKGYCLDYFPAAFIYDNESIYYSKYELIKYSENMTFENLFSKYWLA